MKTKIFLLSLFLSVVYLACEDSISTVGMGILPEEDKIAVFDTIINIESSTVKMDSIYAKTIYGYIGDFYDPTYGTMKAGYICQFYAPETYAFHDSIIDNRIDSVTLQLQYGSGSWIGDSIAPMEVSVYPVVNSLEKDYYTNTDPAKYCDMNSLWGKQAYTTRNLNISDSLYMDTFYGNGGNTYGLLSIDVRMPKEIGQRLLDEYLKPVPNAYSNLDDFVKFFPGLYVKSTYGSGNLLNIQFTNLICHYKRKVHTKSTVTGEDSVYVKKDSVGFTVTKEVIQLNSFTSTFDNSLLQPNPEKTYINSPAGICTKVVIPIPEIIQSIGQRNFSNVKLSFKAYPLGNKRYIGFPGMGSKASAYDQTGTSDKLLLISPDSIKNFFENQIVANSRTSYTTTFSEADYGYTFNNISNVIQNAMEKHPDRNLELYLIPVVTEWYYSSSSRVDYATSNYLIPSGVTLKKGEDNLQLRIIATNLVINE